MLWFFLNLSQNLTQRICPARSHNTKWLVVLAWYLASLFLGPNNANKVFRTATILPSYQSNAKLLTNNVTTAKQRSMPAQTQSSRHFTLHRHRQPTVRVTGSRSSLGGVL